MPDYRTKRQKLEAMANQSVSPNEADVARRKLAEKRLRQMGFSEDDIARAMGPNPYGDVIITNVPDLGGWVALWTSDHFPDDDLYLPDTPLGRKTSPKNMP